MCANAVTEAFHPGELAPSEASRDLLGRIRRHAHASVQAPPDVSALRLADDATLALALCAKSTAAQLVAWERFAPLVRGMARRSLGAYFDIEAMVQEIFLRLFQRINTLREPESLRGFVLAIAVFAIRTTLHTEIRRRRIWNRLAGHADEEPRTMPRCPEAMDAREALARFYDVLDKINDRDRTAFVLRFVDRMDVSAIAAVLDTSVPTARRCFTRAWARFTLLAARDPFLAEYVAKAHAEF